MLTWRELPVSVPLLSYTIHSHNTLQIMETGVMVQVIGICYNSNSRIQKGIQESRMQSIPGTVRYDDFS